MILNANGYVTKRPRLTLLWTNSKPTSAFAANTKVTLDLSGYTFLYVVFMSSTTEQYLNVSTIINDANIINQNIMGQSGKAMSSRQVTISNDGITFSTGYCTKITDDYSVSNTYGTSYAIPYSIYGMLA